MVGSGGSTTDRSKEAIGMMALHEALRTVCLNSDWTYSVFWTIRPRPYVSLSCPLYSLISVFILGDFDFLAVFFSGSLLIALILGAGELEVVMAARLGMIMVACKYMICLYLSYSAKLSYKQG